MNRIKTLVRITRAPFFTATIVPTLVGAAVAWRQGHFQWGYFLLTLLGMICVQVGFDMSNDYFDHVAGTDDINRELTPFSGGSRVIQEGVISARRVLAVSLTFYAAAIVIGVYLAAVRGLPILWLGLIGVFLAFFHNAPPVRLYNLAPGVGELAVGIGCGPLIVLGTTYVQAQRFTWEALLASIPVALLIAAVLYINEFPDVEADRLAGKKTIPVVVGRERAVGGYIALLVGTYATIIIAVAAAILPAAALLALLSLPLAIRAMRGARQYHSDTPNLIPTLAITTQVHLLTGLLLCVGYVIAGLVG